MPKKTEQPEPNIAPMTAMVPLATRNRVDQLAHKEQVSRSEIGRRAIEAYVEEQYDD
jgi:predicted transcriptional regulator